MVYKTKKTQIIPVFLFMCSVLLMLSAIEHIYMKMILTIIITMTFIFVEIEVMSRRFQITDNELICKGLWKEARYPLNSVLWVGFNLNGDGFISTHDKRICIISYQTKDYDELIYRLAEISGFQRPEYLKPKYYKLYWRLALMLILGIIIFIISK